MRLPDGADVVLTFFYLVVAALPELPEWGLVLNVHDCGRVVCAHFRSKMTGRELLDLAGAVDILYLKIIRILYAAQVVLIQ